MNDEVREELGFYHWIYISKHLIKDDGLYKRESCLGIEPYTDEEEIQYVVRNDERKRNWCMVFEDKIVWLDEIKALLHTKTWNVYNYQKQALIKGGCFVEVY